jgi:hypothetical protein
MVEENEREWMLQLNVIHVEEVDGASFFSINSPPNGCG